MLHLNVLIQQFKDSHSNPANPERHAGRNALAHSISDCRYVRTNSENTKRHNPDAVRNPF